MHVKVWSVTRAKDREALGDKITEWLRDSRVVPTRTFVVQSSDRAYHCISVVMLYELPS